MRATAGGGGGAREPGTTTTTTSPILMDVGPPAKKGIFIASCIRCWLVDGSTKFFFRYIYNLICSPAMADDRSILPYVPQKKEQEEARQEQIFCDASA
jgi:hypothetical protein